MQSLKRLILFADFNPPRTQGAIPKWLDSFGSVPWTDVVIGVNTDEPREFRPHVADAALARCVEALHGAGIRPWVMPWIHRNSPYIQAVGKYGVSWAKAGAGVLFDAEWGYLKGRVALSPEAAAAELAPYVADLPLWGVTSYGLLPAAVRPVAALPGCAGFGQSYEVYMRGKKYTHETIYRPGRHSPRAAASWGAVCTDFVPCVGLWSLEHPAPHPRGNTALTVSLDAARAVQTGGVAVWSRKFLPKYPARRAALEKYFNER